jgi:hypothetical protein
VSPNKIKKIHKNKKLKLIVSILAIAVLSSVFFYFFGEKTVEATWWNDSWLYRKSITVNGSQVVGSHTDFPFLLSITDVNLAYSAKADGADIAFADSQGQKLSHEIESYASTTGALMAWIRIPVLSAGQDFSVYMYYGNPTASDQQNAEGVWQSNYSAVWHMKGAAGAMEYDSTSNNNDLSVTGTVGATSTAKLGPAREIAANGNHYLSVADNSTLDGMQKLTFQAWVRDTQGDTSARAFISKRDSITSQISYTAFVFTSRYFFFDNGNADGSSSDTRINTDTETCSQNNWQMLHFVFDGTKPSASRKEIFLNGTSALVGSASMTAITNTTSSLKVGIFNDAYPTSWVGQFDEVRILRDALSADWIATEYNNHNNPASFITVGEMEIGKNPFIYFSFNQNYGTDVYDESSSKYTGAITGAAWKPESECRSGACLSFDGTDDVVSVAGFKFPISNKFTISKFVNLKALATGKPIIGQWGSSQNNLLVKLDDTSSDELKICLASSLTDNCTNYAVTTNADLAINQWRNIQVVYDGSLAANANKLKLYLDGVEKNLSFTGTIPSTSQNGSSGALTIGANSGTFTKAFIDEFKAYAYVRTADQVKQDYNAAGAGISSKKGASVTFGSASDNWFNDGLAAYWKMDESSWSGAAGEVIDATGNGHNGTVTGSANTHVGRFGYGANLDGTDDYISVSSPAGGALDFTGDFTLSVWVKPDVTLSVNTHIIGKTYASSYTLGRHNEGASDRKIAYYVKGTRIAGGYLDYGKWELITATYNVEKQEAILYQQGKVVASGIAAPPLGNNSANFTIGDIAFDGKIDEVRLYNRTLSPQEVEKLFLYAPSPIVRIKMDELSGGTAYDTSGNANHGSITAALWGAGKLGGALSFDGSSSYVNISQNSGLPAYKIKSSFTLAMWVKAEGTGQSDKRIYSEASTSSNNPVYALGTPEAGGRKLSFYIRNDSNSVLRNHTNSTRDVFDNTWHHIAWVDENGAVRLYIDGRLDATDFSYTPPALTPNRTAIGALLRSAALYNFEGLVDDVFIYNYARTQREVLEDMAGGRFILNYPLIHFDFNEGFGATANDQGIYKMNATLYPGGSGGNVTAADMWTKAGSSEGAIEFDGTNDYLEVSGYRTTNDSELSIAFSINPIVLAVNKPIVAQWGGSQNNFLIKTDNTYSDELRICLASTLTDNCTIYAATTDLDLAVGQWRNIQIVYSYDSINSNRLQLYADGILKSLSYTGTIPNTILSGSTASLTIGGNSGAYVNAYLDELKIYNFRLASDEILSINNGGAAASLGQKANPDSRPVLEIKMDEMEGAMAYDTSGKNNHGTIFGAPIWDKGVSYNSLRFDGVDDYIEIADHDTLDVSQEFTLSAWVMKIGTTGENYYRVASKWTTGQQAYQMFVLRVAALGAVANSVMIEVSGGGYRDTGYVIPNNEWHHLAWVHSQSGSYEKLYVDGIIRYTGSYLGNAPKTTSKLLIGKSDDIGYYYNGRIDEVRIYDYALSPDEVVMEYNGGKPVAHWSMNMSEGTTAYDESNNRNHATMVNMSAATDWVPGKIRGALDFDGVDDYVNAGSHYSIDDIFRGGGTVSAWIYPRGWGESSFGRIIDKSIDTSAGSGWAFQLSNDVDRPEGLMFARSFSSSQGSWYVPNSVVLNKWQHVLVVYNEDSLSNNPAIYVDGKLVNVVEYVTPSGTVNSDAAQTAIIGNFRLPAPGLLMA